MANEKSRNHETGGGKGGASKHQGKPDDQDQGQGDSKSASTGKGTDTGAKPGNTTGDGATRNAG
jgi:hypothetical protein